MDSHVVCLINTDQRVNIHACCFIILGKGHAPWSDIISVSIIHSCRGDAATQWSAFKHSSFYNFHLNPSLPVQLHVSPSNCISHFDFTNGIWNHSIGLSHPGAPEKIFLHLLAIIPHMNMPSIELEDAGPLQASSWRLKNTDKRNTK